MNKEKQISDAELKKGAYYLRVFTDIYDDHTLRYVRRGVDIKINGVMARSLKLVFQKMFRDKKLELRRVNGLPEGYVEPLQKKRYRADINCVVSKWDGNEFEQVAGFTGY